MDGRDLLSLKLRGKRRGRKTDRPRRSVITEIGGPGMKTIGEEGGERLLDGYEEILWMVKREREREGQSRTWAAVTEPGD